jgi:hypothetical protein
MNKNRHAHVDADWAIDPDNRSSRSGYVQCKRKYTDLRYRTAAPMRLIHPCGGIRGPRLSRKRGCLHSATSGRDGYPNQQASHDTRGQSHVYSHREESFGATQNTSRGHTLSFHPGLPPGGINQHRLLQVTTNDRRHLYQSSAPTSLPTTTCRANLRQDSVRRRTP